MTTKNLHMVPVIVLDTVDMLTDPRRSQNERDQVRLRLQAIRDYCDAALKKHEMTMTVTNIKVRESKRKR